MNEEIENDILETPENPPVEVPNEPLDNPVEPPKSIAVSPDELRDLIRSGIQETIREYEQRSVQPVAIAPEDPVQRSLSILEERTEMMTEALNLFPGLPSEFQENLKKRLKQVPADQIALFRANGLHRTLAKEAAMDAQNEGKYIPQRFRQAAAPRVEPTGGGIGRLNQNDPAMNSYNAEVDQLESILGIKLSSEERLQAYGR